MITFGTLPENEEDKALLTSIAYLKNPSSNTLWLSSTLPPGSHFDKDFTLDTKNRNTNHSTSPRLSAVSPIPESEAEPLINGFKSGALKYNKGSLENVSFGSLDKEGARAHTQDKEFDPSCTKKDKESDQEKVLPTDSDQVLLNFTSQDQLSERSAQPESEKPTSSSVETAPANGISNSPIEKPVSKPAPKSWASLLSSKKDSKTVNMSGATTVAPSTTTSPSSHLLDNTSSAAKNITHKGKTIPEVFKDIHVSMNAPLFEAKGIQNDNLLCYAHSILQALVHCPPFFNLLKLLSPSALASSFEETPILRTMIDFIKFFRTSKKARGNRGVDVIEPKNIYTLIQSMKSCFSTQIGYQEDAHEFFSALINGLNDEFLSIFKQNHFYINCKFDPSKIPSVQMYAVDPPHSPTADNDSEWISVVPGNKNCVEREFKEVHSPITALFSGVYRHTLISKGKPTSVSHDSSIYLQLEVEPTHIKTLEDSFEHLLKPEALEKSDSVDSFDKPTISKILTFNSLPPILVLHLKNVVYCMERGPRKVHKEISYPLELTIPTSHFSTQNAPSLKYQLMAVVYHHGEHAMAGHYTCDVRRADDSWLFCNDSELKNLLPTEVGTSEHTSDGTPYILFYTRIS